MNLALKWSLIVIYIVTWSCYTFCFSCPHLWLNNERATRRTLTFINCNNYQSKDNSFSNHFFCYNCHNGNPYFLLCKFPDTPDILNHLLKFKHRCGFFLSFGHTYLWLWHLICVHAQKNTVLLYKRRKLFGFHWRILRKISHAQSRNEIARRELILISAIILKSLSLSISISPISLSYFLYPPQTHTFTHKLFEYAKEESEREGEKKPTT